MKRTLLGITITLILGLGIPARAAVTGQWDFNSSNLVATVGTDLAYYGDDLTSSATTFTTATIGGGTAIVMGFPAAANTQGYIMTHGAAPNGGGAYVNQYTLIMDIMFPAASDGKWRGLFQTSTGNANDGDLFVNSGNGIGISGAYSGTILPDTWHRVAFVFDLSLPSAQLLKFIDGAQVGSQVLATAALDGRWSLDPTALLFTDEDGETAAGFVNSFQFHDVALSAADIFALGGPSAAGIPATIPVLTNLVVTVTPTNQNNVVGMTGNHFTATAVSSGTLSYQWYRNGAAVPDQTTSVLRLTNVQLTDAGNYTVVVGDGPQSATSSPPAVLTVNLAPPAFVTGQWDFNSGNLTATVGQALQYFDSTVQADTSFGTTTSLGVSDIAGQPASVMFCNPSVIGAANWGGLILPNGMGPNGGGTNVNQYTVIVDLLYPNWTSGFYRALWQTTPQDTNDADAFFNGNNGIGISSQYDGTLTLDEWHRVVLAFDLTKREFGKYIDGTNVLTGPVGAAPFGPNDAQYLSASTVPTDGGGVDMRWSLGPTALLLADGGDDGEVQPVYVSSVQVRNARMTDAAIAALGAPTATKIPRPSAAIQVTRSGDSVVIVWNGTALESTLNVTGGWAEITNAPNPYVVTSPVGNQFFRARQ
jgi:hypothetical protein